MEEKYFFLTNLTDIYIPQMKMAFKNRNITDYIFTEPYDYNDSHTVGVYVLKSDENLMMNVFQDFAQITQMQKKYLIDNGISLTQLKGRPIYLGCEKDYFPERNFTHEKL